MGALKYGAGILDQQVSLVSRVPTADGMGGATTAENVYATVWAHIRPLRGGELRGSERTEARALMLIVIRNRTDVTEGHIVRWGDRDLNIRTIRPRSPRELYAEMECEMGAAL